MPEAAVVGLNAAATDVLAVTSEGPVVMPGGSRGSGSPSPAIRSARLGAGQAVPGTRTDRFRAVAGFLLLGVGLGAAVPGQKSPAVIGADEDIRESAVFGPHGFALGLPG